MPEGYQVWVCARWPLHSPAVFLFYHNDRPDLTSRRVKVPKYSFEKHNREASTVTLYSPHVLILEGIFTLYDKRILDLLDIKIFAEADADVCLARRSKPRSSGL